MSIKDKVILFAGSILAIGLVVSRVLLAKGKKYMLFRGGAVYCHRRDLITVCINPINNHVC